MKKRPQVPGLGLGQHAFHIPEPGGATVDTQAGNGYRLVCGRLRAGLPAEILYPLGINPL
jgi:hypothetical protein